MFLPGLCGFPVLVRYPLAILGKGDYSLAENLICKDFSEQSHKYLMSRVGNKEKALGEFVSTD